MHQRLRIVILGLLVLAANLSAHEIKVLVSCLVLPEGGGKATVYLSWGHRLPIDELVDGASIDRYELIAPDGATTTLKTDSLSLQTNSITVKDSGVHSVVVVRKPSVFTYVIGDDGERQMKRGPKTEHPSAKIDSAAKSLQSAKSLLVVGLPGNSAPKPLGLPFEIVPQHGPAKWTANTDIRFQVLIDGKPLPGAEVQARPIGFKPDEAWCYATETNRKGEFNLRPSVVGTWIIKAKFKKSTEGKTREEYDYESFTATLSFEVQP